jgi:hypothetical protein
MTELNSLPLPPTLQGGEQADRLTDKFMTEPNLLPRPPALQGRPHLEDT